MGVLDMVLVHSPLVGPGFWKPAARALEDRGWQCRVPTVARAVGDLAPWRDWPRGLLEGLSDVTPGAVVVGHSAAGLVLPCLGTSRQAAGVIFVDAPIAPDAGSVGPVQGAVLEIVRGLPVEDGRLPPWSRWWGPDAMKRLFVDAEALDRFERDLPRLPLEWFDDTIDVPDWSHVCAAYLQTSSWFEGSAEQARARGWPVEAIEGTHLEPLLSPVVTAQHLDTLAARLPGP